MPQHEVFLALLLDSQHRVLKPLELFRGTLTQTSVYPREVVKAALAANAAAVIFAQNRPSLYDTISQFGLDTRKSTRISYPRRPSEGTSGIA